jgi:hypothetical protein
MLLIVLFLICISLDIESILSCCQFTISVCTICMLFLSAQFYCVSGVWTFWFRCCLLCRFFRLARQLTLCWLAFEWAMYSLVSMSASRMVRPCCVVCVCLPPISLLLPVYPTAHNLFRFEFIFSRSLSNFFDVYKYVRTLIYYHSL